MKEEEGHNEGLEIRNSSSSAAENSKTFIGKPRESTNKNERKRVPGTKPHPCRPPIVPFDTEKYSEIFLRLEYLKNLDTEELPRPGEYVIRAMCMGQTYGHFPSGSVDLHSMAYYARIHLCHGGDVTQEAYATLPAMGYICLDVARILDYESGEIYEHVEPWVIPDKTSLGAFLNGTPLLQLSLECNGGFPEPNQLLQGNMMTTFCESLHNLPSIVYQNVSYVDNFADVQVFMTLPHSQAEPVLVFPGGKLRDNFLVEPMFRRISQADEATQTANDPKVVDSSGIHTRFQSSNETTPHTQSFSPGNQQPREPKHWASVKENSPDTPLEATAMAGDTTMDYVESHDGEAEIYGDGREDYLEFSETGDPRIVWNSIHRKHISVSSYRHMLSKLSQNAIWPIEISVAVKRKPAGLDRGKKKKDHKSVGHLQESQPSATNIKSSTSSTDSNEKMIMTELGLQPISTTEFQLVYHGIAFVDLSCLVYPGMKSARFACRLYPFANDLLSRRTCISASAVPELLLATLIPKSQTETKKRPAGRASLASTNAHGTTHDNNQNQPSGARGVGQVRNSQAAQGGRRSDETNAGNKPKVYILPDDVPNFNLPGEVSSGANIIERNPFIVFRISMFRSIVPLYKTTEISKMVNDYLPKRQLMRRKLINASAAQQKYKKAVLEAAAEISHEFSEHYWKDVLQNGQSIEQTTSNAASNETLKKGFLFYLNASGRYLILREHLRSAISHLVQQKCLNLRPAGFHNHRDFQGYLHDMYVFLVDEMNDILSTTTLQETDPLKSNLDRLLQQANCNSKDELSKASLHQRQMNDLGIFAEEAFAQGDFETCHKLHLQRICRDKESSRCWTEFAIMWLSRGDDRMAEISVREALRKDALHLYALLISGMIAVRHGDERGLDCLGAALGLRPMAPEILVIVGVANSLIGNDIAADYFFRKAAYVQRTITGKSTEDIEKLFAVNNARRPYNMNQFARDMDAGIPIPDPLHKNTYGDPVGSRPGNKKGKGQTLKSKNTSKFGMSKEDFGKRGSFGKRMEMTTSQQDKLPIILEDDEELPRTKSGRRSSMEVKANEKLSPTNLTSQAAVAAQPLPNESSGPKFTFLDDLNDIQPEEVELPPLSLSIQSPWNVTDFNERLEQHLVTVDYLKNITSPESKGTTSGGTAYDSPNTQSNVFGNQRRSGGNNGVYNTYIPKDDGVVPDKVLREEYDKLIDGSGDNSGTQSGSTANDSNETSPTTQQTLANPVPATPNATPQSNRRTSEDKGQPEDNEETIVVPIPQAKRGSMNDRAKSTSQRHALTNRLGSELIWTANLLINLRLFDFADGILAKQLYFYAKRTVQFIYLRALSLYLRQREDEALPLIAEAIEMDTTNAMYWALQGHCYYCIGNTQGAIHSYERALKLPHSNENRHLLYLRYGSLVLDSGKSKLAKRVFLHGVSKYPTPYMWLALGNASFQRQEYDQAESAFSEANRLDSTNPITWGHLALSSLVQGKQALAEQAYKWAIRFGLKKGPLLDEIQTLQKEKGYGDPSFPRVPNCVPHDYFLRRMGRNKPFNLYKEALNQDPPQMFRSRHGDTENEMMLKRKLDVLASVSTANRNMNLEWGGEDYYEGNDESEGFEFGDNEYNYVPTDVTQPYVAKSSKVYSVQPQTGVSDNDIEMRYSGAGDLITIKNPPSNNATNPET
ncbi:Cilia- and flagella-associated protein 70 [Orchesella cincta]|uniref:Cilia-and flagella-associated protein 70 n=1 Tax=Orchesella cincta TaxID=48709 RepID=A0A1D2MWC6_ORCCI|nr:Cilia- and flagella-associated protein 70 [Orchesella cincta]